MVPSQIQKLRVTMFERNKRGEHRGGPQKYQKPHRSLSLSSLSPRSPLSPLTHPPNHSLTRESAPPAVHSTRARVTRHCDCAGAQPLCLTLTLSYSLLLLLLLLLLPCSYLSSTESPLFYLPLLHPPLCLLLTTARDFMPRSRSEHPYSVNCPCYVPPARDSIPPTSLPSLPSSPPQIPDIPSQDENSPPPEAGIIENKTMVRDTSAKLQD